MRVLKALIKITALGWGGEAGNDLEEFVKYIIYIYDSISDPNV